MDSLVRFGFGPRALTPEPAAACLEPAASIDTLYFGTVHSDSETGDISGIEFTLEVAGDSLRGAVRRAAGAWGAPLALDSIKRQPGSDSISFVFTTGGRNLYRATVAIRCDGLRGIMTHRTLPWADDTGTTWSFPIAEPRLRGPIHR